MKRILIVEDEKEILEIEKAWLKKAGYEVVEAADGDEALKRFDIFPVDLVLLDLNLPVLDGITVCKKIREKSGIPIIMVTAKVSEVDELLGLEVGADDYIRKPFSPKVLVARVEALLRRPDYLVEGSSVVAGVVSMDLPKQEVKVGSRTVSLTSTQFNILLTLIKNKDRVMTREELINKGYDDTLPPDIFDRTIDAHIKNIRKALGKYSRYIKTVRGVGYKFNEEI